MRRKKRIRAHFQETTEREIFVGCQISARRLVKCTLSPAFLLPFLTPVLRGSNNSGRAAFQSNSSVSPILTH